MRQIAFTAPKTAELVDLPDLTEDIKPHEVRGRTLVSLTSPGTELNWGYLGSSFPNYPGYACVFQVEETGAEVSDLAIGSIVFASGGHRQMQQHAREDVLPLPPGLAPEAAVFARLAGVTMSTLNTTTARPPARVLVTGLGPVGNLAAQIFSSCGYQVTAVDPVKKRRESIRKTGVTDVRDSIANGSVDIAGKIALHVECSGHEQAVLDGCRAVRKRGEVVLVGVPWSRKTEIYASELLHAIFHKYAVVRSGWEWEVPRQPVEFSGNSISENLAAALRWLADGRLKVEGLGSLYAPSQAQEVYSGLLTQSLPTSSALFDWRS
jgi:threonine dehydrogenase-like Zn-dependent dehydrogenase